MLEVIETHHIPSVRSNTRLPSNCIHPDDVSAAREATEGLLRPGHERFVYQAPSCDARHDSQFDRIASYTQVMKEVGLKPRILRAETQVRRPDRRRMFHEWISAPDRATAVIAYAPDEAGLHPLAASQTCLNVPGDLSRLTFHHGAGCFDFAGTQFDSVSIPRERLAKEAVGILQKRIAGEGESFNQIVIACDICAGETVERPRG